MHRGSVCRTFVVFVYLLLPNHSHSEQCAEADQVDQYPTAPYVQFSSIPDNDDVIHVGKNVTLVCNSSLSKEDFGSIYNAQPFEIMIFHGNQSKRKCGVGEIEDSADIKICTVLIPNVGEKDDGNWTCLAQNQMSCTIAELSLKIEAHWKPIFRSHPQNLSVNEGANVTFSCEATGSPTPKIDWLKNNSTLLNVKAIQSGSISLLVLHSVNEVENGGTYKCVANNSVGEAIFIEGSLRVFSPTTNRDGYTTDSRSIKIVWVCVGTAIALIAVATTLVLFLKLKGRCKRADSEGMTSDLLET